MSTTAHDLLQRKDHALLHCAPEDSIHSVIGRLSELGIGALLVMKGQELIGIVSERDIIRHLGSGGSGDAPVVSCATHDLITITPTTAVDRCMQMMTSGRIRHLPVMDGNHVVGVISIGDVVKAELQAKDFLLDQYGQYFGNADAG